MLISLLDKEYTGIVIVDVQEKLMSVMGHKQMVIDNIVRLLHLAGLFNLPVILTEQYSKWLGPTLQEIKDVMPAYNPIEKLDFNCCAVEPFNCCLESNNFKNIILTGVESHICVFQTCFTLLEKGYQVHVPQDAVASRTDENWRVGLDLMREAGGVVTSTEAVIYQILKRAGTREFKEMLKIIK
ncbi:MAG: hydrolase [bacterium]|nr:hydrolase [bacterium]